MVGGSRESVNRILADFVARGLIRFERDTLVVPDRRTAHHGGTTMSEPRESAILQALEEVAARAAAAGRLEPPGGEAVLRSVVEATVALFDAEAASIALHDPGHGPAGHPRRGRAGRRGRRRPGVPVRARASPATCSPPASPWPSATSPRTRASTGRRPRRTGYVPRSILAVPLLDDSGSIGVLEVLDRRGDGGFGLRDLDLASVFARQAAVAIRAEPRGARRRRSCCG